MPSKAAKQRKQKRAMLNKKWSIEGRTANQHKKWLKNGGDKNKNKEPDGLITTTKRPAKGVQSAAPAGTTGAGRVVAVMAVAAAAGVISCKMGPWSLELGARRSTAHRRKA